MSKGSGLIAALALGLVVVGCGGAPPTLPEASPPTSVAADGPGLVTTSAGVVKSEINGTMEDPAAGSPERFFQTPSGICHTFEWPVNIKVKGDLVGDMTILENTHARCDFSHITGSGPFEGEVSWKDPTGNTRAGHISGQWTTNCKFDPEVLFISCDGTMNARGSGGLAGVQFHFKWGPGWYPFPYTGTAFSK